MISQKTLELLVSSFPKILEFGLKVTLPLAVIAFILSTVLAVFVAMVQFAEEECISEKSSCNVSSYVGLILAVETSATAMRNFNSLEFKILHNNTKTNFVTGDAPFIELGDSATNNLIFPLSPQLAFYLGDKTASSFPHRYDNMTEDTVRELNERLVAQCVNQVYALSTSDLITFDKFA